MSAQYPTSVPTYQTILATEVLNSLGGEGLASRLNNLGLDIIAIANKLGTGASTPTAGKVYRATGTGTAAWGQVVLTTDVTGLLPVTNIATFTSAQLRALVTDETGTGVAVFGTSPTIATPTLTTPVIADFTSATHTHVSAATGGVLTTSALPSGSLLQEVNALFSAVATGTTIIPGDDTIPQNTEGSQFMTLAITPKATTNTLYIEVIAHVAKGAIDNLIGALFQDSTANALAAGKTRNVAADAMTAIVIRHTMAAGTTSATTFKVRLGPQGAGTLTFNGEGGARILGGITLSSITIREVKA
jgi:hypothetical protein